MLMAFYTVRSEGCTASAMCDNVLFRLTTARSDKNRARLMQQDVRQARSSASSGDELGTLQRGRHARRRWRTSPAGSPLRAGRRARFGASRLFLLRGASLPEEEHPRRHDAPRLCSSTASRSTRCCAAFHCRMLPMPDEDAAVQKFTEFTDEAGRWTGTPLRTVEREGRRLSG